MADNCSKIHTRVVRSSSNALWLTLLATLLAGCLSGTGTEARSLDAHRLRTIVLPIWHYAGGDVPRHEGSGRSAAALSNNDVGNTADDDDDDDNENDDDENEDMADDYIDSELLPTKPTKTPPVMVHPKPHSVGNVVLHVQRRPTAQSGDESRTFFKHHSGGAAPAVPSFVVLSTPFNFTNINNNNISTGTTPAPAAAGRIQLFGDSYLPTGVFRTAPMGGFRQRQHQSAEPNAPLPYGLFAYDGNQVLPLSAADLRYVPLNLRRFGDGDRSGSSSGSGSVSEYDYSDEREDASNVATSSGFNLFGGRWRANSNPKPNRHAYNSYMGADGVIGGGGGGGGGGGLAAFANNFRRIQYL